MRKDVPEPDNRNYNANELVFVKKGPNPINLRETTGHYELPPGEYIIIPFIFQANVNGKFFLRVFTEYESADGFGIVWLYCSLRQTLLRNVSRSN